MRKTKRRMHSDALAFREWSNLHVTWRVWTRRLYQKYAGREMEALALQHWAQSLQFRALLQWNGLYLHIRGNKQEEAWAVTYFRHRELRKSMKAWLGYLQLRREKRHQEKLAQQHHHSGMLQRCFSIWWLAWTHGEGMRIHQEHIGHLAARIALRRVFTHWKHYVVLCSEVSRQYELAEHHHRHHLLYIGFTALRENVVNARLQQMRRNLAHQQHQVMLLKSFWNCWKSRLEQKEEEQQLSLTLAAHSHYRVTLLSKYLRFWLQNAKWKKLSQMQYAKADHHYRRIIMPATFQTWRRFTDHQQWWREMKEMASYFHRETLTRRVFDRWRLSTGQQRENRMTERMAILHSEQKLLIHFWCSWCRRTMVRLEEQEGLSLAHDHYCHLVQRRAFCVWKENIQEIKTERTKEVKALTCHYSKCLQWSWSRWRQYVRHQCEKWKKLVRADMHYRHSLLGKVLAAWKTYQCSTQHILCLVAEKEKKHNRELLRQVLHIWKGNAIALVDEAKKGAQAEQHYRRATVLKVLFQWRDAASLQVYCRWQETAAVRDARKHLDMVRLRGLFLHWKEFYIRSSVQRAQLKMAAQHHGRQLLCRCLAGWKQQHLQCIRKTLLQRWGDQLTAQRICSSCFSLWKRQLAQKGWEEQKTVQALWHWSLALQGKVFDAWVGFVLEQRRKKSRISRDVEVYRDNLLREGVAHILRYAAGMKQFRGELQAQHQLKAAYSLHQSVYRCAMLWKQKALCKKQDEPCSFPPPLKKRVTFKVPMPDASFGAKGDKGEVVSLRPALQPIQSDDLPVFLAAGDSIFSELLETSKVPLQPTVTDKHPLQDGVLSAATQTDPSSICLLSQPSSTSFSTGPLPSAALPWSQADATCPKQASPRLELLPPSSFMTRLRNGSEIGGSQSLNSCPNSRSRDLLLATAEERKQPDSQAHLLLPEDFMGKEIPSLVSEMAAKSKIRSGNPMEEKAPQNQLEAELQHIQEKMQSYHRSKQELKSCQKQARILHKRLELRTRTEKQEKVQQDEEKLDQLEAQIDSLTKVLLEERHRMQSCLTRVRDIRATYNM
uniref:SFI1 centrin binding protein n=1 Tax=Sphenodon punctatus TaxID=8508 RepID=A0A8D0LA18_SPHPU